MDRRQFAQALGKFQTACILDPQSDVGLPQHRHRLSQHGPLRRRAPHSRNIRPSTIRKVRARGSILRCSNASPVIATPLSPLSKKLPRSIPTTPLPTISWAFSTPRRPTRSRQSPRGISTRDRNRSVPGVGGIWPRGARTRFGRRHRREGAFRTFQPHHRARPRQADRVCLRRPGPVFARGRNSRPAARSRAGRNSRALRAIFPVS